MYWVRGLFLLLFTLMPLPVWGLTTGTLNITDDTTLTEDHIGNIIIGADGITLDCASHTVTGSGSGIGIDLIGRTGWTVKNCIVSNFYQGFDLSGSSDGALENNTAIDNAQSGFRLYRTSGNMLIENTAMNSGAWAFYIESSTGTILLRNTASNNTIYGYYLLRSDGNTLIGNTAVNNVNNAGFILIDSSQNTLNENTALGNQQGFALTPGSIGNTIYHNNIIDNGVQASDSNPAANDWHDPDLLEGNYWSDYPGVDDGSGTAKHAIAGDGIGDTNIPWPGTDFDNHPFITESGWGIIPIPSVPELGAASPIIAAAALLSITIATVILSKKKRWVT